MVARSYTLIREGHWTSSPQREGVDLKFFRSNCARLVPIEQANMRLQRSMPSLNHGSATAQQPSEELGIEPLPKM
jgi:hypothetical protein